MFSVVRYKLLIFLVLFQSVSFATERNELSECKSIGEISVSMEAALESSSEFVGNFSMLLTQHYEPFQDLKTICENIVMVNEAQMQVPLWISQCSYSGIVTWFKTSTRNKNFQLFVCPQKKETSPKSIFPYYEDSNNFDKAQWIVPSIKSKLDTKDGLITIDTSKHPPGEGFAERIFPEISASKKFPKIRVEYMFKNFINFPNHQQRLWVGGGIDPHRFQFSNLMHPLLTNNNRFSIWTRFYLGNEIDTRSLWLNYMDVNQFYRVVYELDFKNENISYYIYNENFQMLSSARNLEFFQTSEEAFKVIPKGITSVRIGDDCGDSGFAGYKYIAITNDYSEYYDISGKSDFFSIKKVKTFDLYQYNLSQLKIDYINYKHRIMDYFKYLFSSKIRSHLKRESNF